MQKYKNEYILTLDYLGFWLVEVVKLDLNEKQLVFLNQYFRNPILPFSKLSKITSISQITLKNYYDLFKQSDFLLADHFKKDQVLGTRIHSDVTAMINLEKLGLGTYIVSFEITEENTYEIIENIKSIPYLAKIYDIMIPLNLVVLEFNLPEQFINHYSEFFHLLERLKITSSVNEYFYTTISHSHLNFQKLETSFNSKDLQTLMDNFSKAFRTRQKNDEPEDDLDFDQVDLELIRELQINGHLSLTNISGYYDRDLSTLSRRVNAIKENVVSDFLVSYNMQFLDQHNFLVVGNASPRVLTALQSMIEDDVFWFESQFFSAIDSFLWILKLSLDQFSVFQKFLTDVSSLQNVYISKSIQFQNFIDHNNYDEMYKTWLFNDNVMNNIRARITLGKLPDWRTIGANLERIVDTKDVDIYGKLENNFLNVLDLVDSMAQNDQFVFDEVTVANILKLHDDVDKYMVLSLLNLYGQDLTDLDFQYLIDVITKLS